ncbi:hypothetical protein K431DRAFT_290027 [Polychaeton citri CBS 116435]|uniref:Uncharacterized protein n=1 Tax=Polychaeton citri CBS 116435 TaxID=1314669 RepID=A0A9P4QF71_9PEZI|nr:hypothetical protein K431DRAFT_290027 [Polychaeton citri CBS 116435]
MRWSRDLCILALAFSAWVGSVSSYYINESSRLPQRLPYQPDGRGISYAKSCEAELLAYSTLSLSYFLSEASTSTWFYTGIETIRSNLPGTTAPVRVVTLCDGYPRVVGHPYRTEGSLTTTTETWTNTNPTIVASRYPGPSPACSIGPRDCALLSSSYESQLSRYLTSSQADVPSPTAPPCTTPTPNITYSTDSHGNTCDQCMIVGHSIRLLYWPVTTVVDSGNLCGKPAETITPENTRTAPRTFVTDGFTITSPSIGVSISGLSRADGCGHTIKETIIPVPPSEVTSVRGARALFSHWHFNVTDLNYKCLDDPDKIFVTDEGRDDCYQEVPAEAYWNGHALWAGLGGRQGSNATIWDNYQPQVLPPMTLTDEIKSIWGNGCFFNPNGVWDPPRALQEEGSAALPTLTGGYGSQYTSPTPGSTGPTQPYETDNPSTATALPDNDSDLPQTSHNPSATSWPESRTDWGRPGQSSHGPSGGSDSWAPGGGNGRPLWPEVVTKTTVGPGKAVVVVHSVTVTVGAMQTAIDGEPVSAGSNGVICGTGQGQTTIPYVSNPVTSAEGTTGSGSDQSSDAVPATTSERVSYSAGSSPSGSDASVFASASGDASTSYSTLTTASSGDGTIRAPQVYTVGGATLTYTTEVHGSPCLVGDETTITLASHASNTVAIGTQSYTVEPAATGGYIVMGASTTIQLPEAEAEATGSSPSSVTTSKTSGLTLSSGGASDSAATTPARSDNGANTAETGSSSSQSPNTNNGLALHKKFGFATFAVSLMSLLYLTIA